MDHSNKDERTNIPGATTGSRSYASNDDKTTATGLSGKSRSIGEVENCSPNNKRLRLDVNDVDKKNNQEHAKSRSDYCAISSTTMELQRKVHLEHDVTSTPHVRQDCPVFVFKNEQANSCLDFCTDCTCYVCNVPAKDCTEWRSHCRATRDCVHWSIVRQDRQRQREAILIGSSYRPEGTTEGLFDYHTEEQRIKASLRVTSQGNPLVELKARAKDTKYQYQDKETLLLAVELYNYSNKVYRERHWWHQKHVEMWDETRVFQSREVVGHHTIPCDECGIIDFRRKKVVGSNDVYFVDKWGPTKVCSGCMGRNVCSLYGTNRTGIETRLEAIKEMHARTKRVLE